MCVCVYSHLLAAETDLDLLAEPDLKKQKFPINTNTVHAVITDEAQQCLCYLLLGAEPDRERERDLDLEANKQSIHSTAAEIVY